MKQLLPAILAVLMLIGIHQNANSQITCTSGANLFVYANYDGGVLNINVDVNIPNIKIGICTYEPVTVNLSGAYVGNVTEVRYAGYVSTNNFHCANSPSTTTITGVPSGITSVNFLPSSTLGNPNGYSSIVCAYSCGTSSSQGGCNTADQIKDYFQQTTGGVLTSYFTQYGCWNTAAYTLSSGGNCCSAVLPCNMTASAGSDQQICPGATVPLTGSGTGGVVTYAWTPTNGLSAPNSASTMASPTVTTTYILTVSDGSGACTAQDTVVVTVLQPQASLGAFSPICTNDSSFLLTQGMPSGGAYSGSGVSNGIFLPAQAGAGNHLISYTVADSNGCTATATATITVNASPQMSHSSVGPFCENDAPFTLSGGSPAGGTYVGNAVNNGVFSPSAAVLGLNLVEYNVTNALGCSGNTLFFIEVNANPNAPVLNFAPPTLSTPSTGDSIQWFLNGSYLLTNGSSITPTTSGNYSAIVWGNGCPSDTSADIQVTLVGLESGNLHGKVSVWPNPAKDVLHLEAKGLQFEVTLYDALGRMLREGKAIDQAGTISLEGLSKGIYVLRVISEGEATSIKLLKE